MSYFLWPRSNLSVIQASNPYREHSAKATTSQKSIQITKKTQEITTQTSSKKPLNPIESAPPSQIRILHPPINPTHTQSDQYNHQENPNPSNSSNQRSKESWKTYLRFGDADRELLGDRYRFEAAETRKGRSLRRERKGNDPASPSRSSTHF